MNSSLNIINHILCRKEHREEAANDAVLQSRVTAASGRHSGKSAFAEGIGEQLLPLEIPPTRYVVIWPGVHVSTAEIFASPSLTRNTKSKKIHVFSDLIQEDWPLLPGRNDLQPVAELAAPEIGQAVDALHACGLKPRMTGSGSAVFAVQTSDLPVSLAALPSNWALFQAAGLAQHPLSSWVPE